MSERRKLKILVVDDERSNIDALSFILKQKYTVLVAKDGQMALKVAKSGKPDLILLDVVMPGMSGFEVLTELKSADETHSIPVIFITGRDSAEDERKGLLLGAVDYITKPFHDAIVEARVRTHLQIVEHIRTIERLCMMDALTNLPNRRSFDSRISLEWERAKRYNSPVSILMVDIDNFKKYNDTFGHPQGDALLTAVASIFEQSMLRPADFIARWGGEEFAALLPDTDLAGALEVAERLRAETEDMVVTCLDGTETQTTVSIGVNCIIPEQGSSVEDLLQGADKALYIAKAEGKNTVRTAPAR